MKGCRACLLIAFFSWGAIPVSVALSDDEHDLFQPAWMIPADALHPQNVQRSFEPYVPVQGILFNEQESAARQKSEGPFKTASPTLHLPTPPQSVASPKTEAAPAQDLLFNPSQSLIDSVRKRFDETKASSSTLPTTNAAAPRDRRTHWEDDSAEFRQRTAAKVNGGRLLNRDVLDRYGQWLISAREQLQMQGKPESEFIKAREELLMRELPQQMKHRILVDALESSLSPERLVPLQKLLDGMFEKQIRRLMQELKVTTTEELEVELEKKGSPLKSVRQAFVAEHLSGTYVQLELTKTKPIEQREMLDYYESHRAEYRFPARVDWEQIQVSFEGASAKNNAYKRIQEALQELEQGASVVEIARKYSDGVMAGKGGRWDGMEAGTLKDVKLERLLFDIPLQQWSEIYVSSTAFQLVRVQARREAGRTPFSEVEEKIRQTMEKARTRQRTTELIQRAFDEATREVAGTVWPASGQTSWLGKKVFLKMNADWKSTDESFRWEQIRPPLTVIAEDGDRLNLGRFSVRQVDVMGLPEALDYFSDAVVQTPEDPHSWIGRGLVWHRKGYATAAIADFTEAIRLDVSRSMSYCHRGLTYSLLENHSAAIKDMTEAIRLDPQCAVAYWGRGVARSARGETDAGLQDLSEAIRLDPKLSVAYSSRATDLWKHSQDAEASLRDLQELIRLDPASASTSYFRRAEINSQKGNFEAAIRDLEQAIQIDPNNADPYNSLAFLLATCPDDKVRNGNRAIELATTACELSYWKDRNPLEVLAAAYAETGDWDNALLRQQQALKFAEGEQPKREAQSRLDLYKTKKPFRHDPTAAKTRVDDIDELLRKVQNSDE